MTKHTPTPWRIRRNQSTNKPSCEITTSDKISICYMSNGDLGLGNAAHIVKCVNMHDELLEACIEATALFDNHPEIFVNIGTYEVLTRVINKALEKETT
jgi:hypothetical protein